MYGRRSPYALCPSLWKNVFLFGSDVSDLATTLTFHMPRPGGWISLKGLSKGETLEPASRLWALSARSFSLKDASSPLLRLGSQKGQQVSVELLLMCAGEAVGCARIDLQGRVLDYLGGEEGRGTDWHNLVVVAVDDQGRNVEFPEIFSEVRLRESLDAVVRAFETDGHRPEPERIANAL